MKFKTTLAGIMGYSGALREAWATMSRKELKWGDNRLAGALLILVVSMGYVGVEYYETYQKEVTKLKSTIAEQAQQLKEQSLELSNTERILAELNKTLAKQSHYVTELEKTILELRAKNKSSELEIASLQRLLVAASDRQLETEKRLKTYLEQINKAKYSSSEERESLLRRFNSLSNPKDS